MDRSIFCPVCWPESYYAGKTGLTEEAGAVCQSCVAHLTPYALRFDAVNKTDYYPVTTEIVQCKSHADGFNLLLDESLFSVQKDGINFVFYKNPAISIADAAGDEDDWHEEELSDGGLGGGFY